MTGPATPLLRIGATLRAHAALLIFLIAAAGVLFVAHLPAWPSLGFLLILLSAGFLFFAFPAERQANLARKEWICLGLGIIGLALLLLYRIGAPWTDHCSANGAVWSLHGRNIARHGFIATQGMLFSTGGPILDTQARIANHHPPGLVWLLAVLFKIFGPSEGVARAVPFTFTLAGAGALLAWMLRRHGPSGAGGVLLAAAACPALIYIGRMVNFEPLVLALSLIFYVGLDRFPGHRPGGLVAGMIGLALAPLLGWVGAIWAFIAAWFFVRERAVQHRAWVYMIPPVILVGLVLFLSNKETGGISGTLARSMKWNYAFRPTENLPSLTEWLTGVGRFLNIQVPFPLWFFFPLLALRPIRAALPKTLLIGTLLPFALLLPIMPRAFYNHEYHIISLWLLVALLSGALAVNFRKTQRARLGLALLLMVPLFLGMRTYQKMHQPFENDLHERLGKRINTTTPPQARIALLCSKKAFEPVLWFYMDRQFFTYWSRKMSLDAIDSWDYVLVPPNKQKQPGDLPPGFALKPVFTDPGGAILYQKTETPPP